MLHTIPGPRILIGAHLSCFHSLRKTRKCGLFWFMHESGVLFLYRGKVAPCKISIQHRQLKNY